MRALCSIQPGSRVLGAIASVGGDSTSSGARSGEGESRGGMLALWE